MDTIVNTEKELKSLESEIEKLNKQIDKEHKKINDYQKKIAKNVQSIREKLFPLCEQYNTLIVEHWKNRGQLGLNKGIDDRDIPNAVKKVYYKLRETYSQGCKGDPYDGCRDCNVNCSLNARTDWKKMFGI